jgi:hypothetical protein
MDLVQIDPRDQLTNPSITTTEDPMHQDPFFHESFQGTVADHDDGDDDDVDELEGVDSGGMVPSMPQDTAWMESAEAPIEPMQMFAFDAQLNSTSSSATGGLQSYEDLAKLRIVSIL